MNNSTQITTVSARISSFLRTLRLDRRGAELVEVLIVLAVVALGGLAAMQAIQKSIDGKGKALAGQIDGIK